MYKPVRFKPGGQETAKLFPQPAKPPDAGVEDQQSACLGCR